MYGISSCRTGSQQEISAHLNWQKLWPITPLLSSVITEVKCESVMVYCFTSQWVLNDMLAQLYVPLMAMYVPKTAELIIPLQTAGM